MGHLTVHVAREVNKACLNAGLPRLPREIERVDRNAMATETWSGIEGHESEWLCRSGIDHLPDVDTHPVAHHREFIHQADVDHSEGILEKLGHLGDFGGADGNNIL